MLAAALALVLCACGEPTGSGASDVPSPAPRVPDYAGELARIDADVARLRASAGERRDAWPAHERLAQALLERARLTGDFDDYTGAAHAAAAVERLGGPHAGCAVRARVALGVHRLAAAEAIVIACAQAPQLARVELAALNAEFAFHSGRYRDALRQAREVLEQRQSPQDFARLALVHGATGSPIEALALLESAENADHAGTPALRAWLALQRGLIALHRGRREEALTHYLAAQRRLSGWWLVDEHIAEVHAQLGHPAEAAAIYARVIAAHPHAELMDAYARLLVATGRAPEAAAWVQRARAEHQRRRDLLPEAADGHALAHALAFEPTAAATLELAQRVVRARPTGSARLALARALLAGGRTREAAAALREAAASGWDTAEMHALAARALDAAGQRDAAAAAAARAQSMNPRWRSQYEP